MRTSALGFTPLLCSYLDYPSLHSEDPSLNMHSLNKFLIKDLVLKEYENT